MHGMKPLMQFADVCWATLHGWIQGMDFDALCLDHLAPFDDVVDWLWYWQCSHDQRPGYPFIPSDRTGHQDQSQGREEFGFGLEGQEEKEKASKQRFKEGEGSRAATAGTRRAGARVPQGGRDDQGSEQEELRRIRKGKGVGESSARQQKQAEQGEVQEKEQEGSRRRRSRVVERELGVLGGRKRVKRLGDAGAPAKKVLKTPGGGLEDADPSRKACVGSDLSGGSKGGLGHHHWGPSYFNLMIRPYYPNDNLMKEMNHLSVCLDELRAGELGKLGDRLASRFLALHTAASEGSWRAAPYLELHPLDATQGAPASLLLEARKHGKLVDKAQGGEEWRRNRGEGDSWAAGGKESGKKGKGRGKGKDWPRPGKGDQAWQGRGIWGKPTGGGNWWGNQKEKADNKETKPADKDAKK